MSAPPSPSGGVGAGRVGSSSPEHVEEESFPLRQEAEGRACSKQWLGNGDFVVLGVGPPMDPAPICEGRGTAQ